jgi:hypothetical protein
LYLISKVSVVKTGEREKLQKEDVLFILEEIDMSNTVFFQSEASSLVYGHLDTLTTDQCIRAYSSIVENTNINGQ